MTDRTNIHSRADGLSALHDYLAEHPLPFSRGIEKEGLRVTQESDIAQSDHPQALGHPLTHDSITTDYSEALLELITGVHPTREALVDELKQVHQYVQRNIDGERLWAGSMPCRLNGNDSIRIAEYGPSNIGQLKHAYRQGLGVRYGRIMQSIAGLHFNFSFRDDFWQARQQAMGNEDSLKNFKSDQYFGLIRNFRRQAWLLMYLFGASPVLDQSFLDTRDHNLDQFDDKGSFYKPHATSLRMGDLGYHNNAQSSLSICFNTLGNFTNTLGKAVRTSYEPYERIGTERDGQVIQLNTNILQIENEYYSSIRPKRTTKSVERPTDALIERGVEYIEVRCLDLNPFYELGVCNQQIDFLDLFLTQCLLSESPFIGDDECLEIDQNFSNTVNEGRNPEMKLSHHGKQTSLKDWAMEILDGLQGLAEILDSKQGDGRYAKALKEQVDKVNIPELTPSAQILNVMQQESLSWLEFASEISNKHQICFNQLSRLTSDQQRHFEQMAAKSFADAEKIAAADTMTFEEYLAAYDA